MVDPTRSMRTVREIEAALHADAELAVDTEALLVGVMRGARRRRARRAVSATAATAVAVALAVLTAPALLRTGPNGGLGPDLETPVGQTPLRAPFSGDCTVQSLAEPPGQPAGLPMMVVDMDPSGRYVIGSYGPPVDPADDGWSNLDNRLGRLLPVLWDNGVPQVLTVGGEHVSAAAVNVHGTVVGVTHVDSRVAAWVDNGSTGGGWSLLPMPDGYAVSSAIDINERGEIVGEATDRPATDGVTVIWSPRGDGTYAVRTLPEPGEITFTHSIATDGTVVGILFGGQPYVWDPDGTGRTLPLPEGKPVGGVNQVRGDWAVGFAAEPGAGGTYVRSVLVRWHLPTGELSIVDTTDRPFDSAVNAAGDVVFMDGASAVLRRDDGRSYDLPRLPGTTSPDNPAAISDDATVVAGTADVPFDVVHRGVLWHC